MEADVRGFRLDPFDVVGLDLEKVAAAPDPEVALFDMGGGLAQLSEVRAKRVQPPEGIACGQRPTSSFQRLFEPR